MDMQARWVGGWWKVCCMTKRFDLLKQKLDDLPNTADKYDEEMMSGIAYIATKCENPQIKAAYANIWTQVNKQKKK